ncbi:DUF3313 family protein [Terricaulis sp.]|uniref:DUF3313 family protein n=1 Tax=Terricaulis sp. TaxID=2768686 RepID=UPI0037844F00
MRTLFALSALAALTFAGAAAADPVTIAPVSFSPEFQRELDRDIGAREGDILRNAVVDAVGRALAQRGAALDQTGGVSIEITIVDADPNRPTFQQLRYNPSLDPARSVSLGGAELVAVIRGADGRVLSEVRHRRYNHSLEDLVGPPTTWTEARRAISQFATKVADAYAANAS